MKSFKEMKLQINEKLNKSDDISTWISDFVHSDAPQFKGKSKEKRIEMAKAAYYTAQKEGVIQPNGTDKVDEADIPLSDKEKNKMLSKKDKGTLGKIAALMAKQKKPVHEGYYKDIDTNRKEDERLAKQKKEKENKKPKDWAQALNAEDVTYQKPKVGDRVIRDNKGKDEHGTITKLSGSHTHVKYDAGHEIKHKKHELDSLHPDQHKKLKAKFATYNESASSRLLNKLKDIEHKKNWAKNLKVPDYSQTPKKEPIDLSKPIKEDYEVKHLDSYKDGQQSAKDGKKHSDNPHPKNSKAHLNWSKGHNTQRANKMNEGNNDKVGVSHAANAVAKTFKGNTKTASNFLSHLKAGTKKTTTWGDVNKALVKQGVQTHHIAKVAGHLKDKFQKEEVEQIDELSKKTLGSYVKKASFNAAQAAYQAGGSGGNIPRLQPHMDKLNKRTAGVNKATDKLTKVENTDPAKAAEQSKKAQMVAKHATEREALAKKHQREKDSMKEETTMLSFEDFLKEADMKNAVKYAVGLAKKHAGNMTHAVKTIEKKRKGLSNHPEVASALKTANEDWDKKKTETVKHPNQKVLDVDGDGKIEKDDFKKLRKSHHGKKDESNCNEGANTKMKGDDPCWDSHEMVGMKMKNGKKVPNCVPKNEGILDKLGNKLTQYTMKKYQEKDPKGFANFQKAQASGVFNMKKEDTESSDDIIFEKKSYKSFTSEMDSSKRYVHKGTRYGGSAQHDDSEFDNDDYGDKEKYKQKLFGKPAKKEPAVTPVKRGRGRPMGSKSGARN